MDMKKIFLKDACPTAVGGQAVMEGIMMKSEENISVALRLPNGEIHIKTEKQRKRGSIMKMPILRGVLVFISSLVQGTQILMYSANIMERYNGPGAIGEGAEESKFEKWITEKFGERALWNIIMYLSVIFSIVVSVGIFVVGPTALVNWLKSYISNSLMLNLIEGILRIIMFVAYIGIISRMQDIKKLFQYHGAEHKCIHCFENGEELTPDNCQKYYTLHPRCGTSFLMFVMVISLVLFSLLGWPDLVLRVLSRLLLIPVIAGMSYEFLKWAGRSAGLPVKVLSMPGLLLQKLTTREPDSRQLEVAIAAMEAVLTDNPSYGEGICDERGRIIRENEFISTRSS